MRVLQDAGYDAFVVGGSVRDVYTNRIPKDYDITTNAAPEIIQTLFDDTLYNNTFGTVVVRITEDDQRNEIEITPYRAESSYDDGRHPSDVTFGVSLEKDLERRDFTINAMASDGKELIDPFDGKTDCEKKVIRTVGNPRDRFSEDALRLLRAARFAAQLGYRIEDNTRDAMKECGEKLQQISFERIRDELMKIVCSDDPYRGIWILYETDLLPYVLPELLEGVRVGQNKHHMYSVFMHNLLSLQYCPSDDPLVRFAALLHDIGKPRTKEGNGPNSTFYNHDHVGAEMTRTIMKRLAFSKQERERVAHLVDLHMFYYTPGELTDAGVRRLVKRIGKENIDDFMDVRVADRMGSGCQKEKPFSLIELERRIRDVEKDPMDTTMLKIDGHDVMRITGIAPGREIGVLMNLLLQDVLEDPSLNTESYLTKRVKEIYQENFKATLS